MKVIDKKLFTGGLNKLRNRKIPNNSPKSGIPVIVTSYFETTLTFIHMYQVLSNLLLSVKNYQGICFMKNYLLTQVLLTLDALQ